MGQWKLGRAEGQQVEAGEAMGRRPASPCPSGIWGQHRHGESRVTQTGGGGTRESLPGPRERLTQRCPWRGSPGNSGVLIVSWLEGLWGCRPEGALAARPCVQT